MRRSHQTAPKHEPWQAHGQTHGTLGYAVAKIVGRQDRHVI